MSRSIPQKCIKCATLQAPDAKTLHGPDGDNCWDSSVCPARRHYIRNRERINQHCIGMVPSQVYHYTDLMVELLKQRYGLKGFALIQVRTPDRCPLRPCPCHPALVS